MPIRYDRCELPTDRSPQAPEPSADRVESAAQQICNELAADFQGELYGDDQRSMDLDFACGNRASYLGPSLAPANDLRWAVRRMVERELAQVYELVYIPGEPSEYDWVPIPDPPIPHKFILVSTDRLWEGWRSGAILELPAQTISQPTPKGSDLTPPRPNWDEDARVLSVGEVVLKQYRHSAINQTDLLRRFQEAGWPRMLRVSGHDYDLGQTVYQLNKSICQPRKRSISIQFSRDGTVTGVVWEYTGRIPATQARL